MRMLVFGKNGQVAKALKDLAGESVVALGHDEADLMQAGAAQDAIGAHQPDVIVNAAAYTAVDKAETEEDAASRLNCAAPEEMAIAAAEAGIPFIHISTDYVFDGTAEGRLDENAAVNPLNVYGRTKHEGERAVLKANPDAVILRTSWVFSQYGANFVKTMLRLAKERDELTIVADQIGGPTDAADIARAILAIAGKKHRGAPGAGIYHFQGAPAVSWADFATKIFEIAEAPVKVSPIRTEDYPTPARRPRNTMLDCAKIERDFGIGQPDWREGLRRVIAALKQEGQAS
ncbi:dTDP-4-dehydrorhamnose reductase [Hyphococcus sp.]|jgi:dTDP-4-dehydrorhamnose reductase|uniref:dTDP-4-dehydrorhamnose reductase n=1 Tax=Hyphococcus sp. TaxID=2038636 RepID=UPI003D126A21